MSLNFKVYGLLKINDDHFLMITLVVSSILAALSKFLWGYIIDKLSFKKVIIASLILGGGFTLSLPFVSEHRSTFMIWYTMITICERGFLTIGPPILIKLFGVDSGSHLIPFY